MQVAQILEGKGSRVATAKPGTTIAEAVASLSQEGIGALVVTDEGEQVAGIISERDIVRGLNTHGPQLLTMRVDELMTREVVTCGPRSRVEELMKKMTVRRIRHLPVLECGELSGIISIGDVVKNRLEELETETTMLREYIVGHA
jgi:CBS domain-containing protein